LTLPVTFRWYRLIGGNDGNYGLIPTGILGDRFAYLLLLSAPGGRLDLVPQVPGILVPGIGVILRVL
jgi:hypothetical protein